MKENGNIFEKRLAQLGIKKQVDAAMIVAEAQERINKIFGQRGQENIRVISFNKGMLKIATSSSAWANECQGNILKFKKPPIERVIFLNVTNIEEI